MLNISSCEGFPAEHLVKDKGKHLLQRVHRLNELVRSLEHLFSPKQYTKMHREAKRANVKIVWL